MREQGEPSTIIQTIVNMLFYKMEKKYIVYNEEFKYKVSITKIRLLHPMGFILAILALLMFGLSELKDIKENYCII